MCARSFESMDESHEGSSEFPISLRDRRMRVPSSLPATKRSPKLVPRDPLVPGAYSVSKAQKKKAKAVLRVRKSHPMNTNRVACT